MKTWALEIWHAVSQYDNTSICEHFYNGLCKEKEHGKEFWKKSESENSHNCFIRFCEITRLFY